MLCLADLYSQLLRHPISRFLIFVCVHFSDELPSNLFIVDFREVTYSSGSIFFFFQEPESKTRFIPKQKIIAG